MSGRLRGIDGLEFTPLAVAPSPDSQLGSLVALDLGCASSLPELAAAAPRIAVQASRVWLLRLSSEDHACQALWPLLAADERARAQAFRVEPARRQYIQVRAALRRLLAGCLGVAAAELEFDYGDLGKPVLSRHPDWHFNVSHSGEFALLCIANGREVGVDIERRRSLSELEPLLKMVLSPAEIEHWGRQPLERRVAAFFTAWTAKEAVAKAVGQGLRLDFPSLSVGDLDENAMTRVRRVAVAAFGDYQLLVLPAPAGYAAALALREVSGSDRSVGSGR